MSEWTAINNIRVICAEMIEKAESGHPGAPLGIAPFLYVLYSKFLRFDPDDPEWINRDIFIMSNGHACAIHYVLNHLIGYDVKIDDLCSFRKIYSKTPGHPEKGATPGVEITTGALGQGLANAVGFAIAIQKMYLQNTKDTSIFTGKVYCIFGDGCYQEGIAHEAFSLAGHLKLENLVFIYDYNETTIDGSISLSMSDDVVKKFEAYNFEVDVIEDGNTDLKKMEEVLSKKANKTRIIILKNTIGKESEMEGDPLSHGTPLGIENIKKLKQKTGMPVDKEFLIKEEVYDIFNKVKAKRRSERKAWNEIPKGDYKINIPDIDISWKPDGKMRSTTEDFNVILNETHSKLPMILSGSADITSSSLTLIDGEKDFTAIDRSGNHLRYGIREHGMFGIMNGIAAFGCHIPFSGVYLNYVYYGIFSVKLAAMSKLKVVYVLTHDSIALGGDGANQQPVETLVTLRSIPDMLVIRPCDAVETRMAFKIALENNGPTALVLSKQALPLLENTSSEGVSTGAYFLIKHERPSVIIVGTGSEVSLGAKVVKELEKRKIHASLVSFPSFELFERQSCSYKESIFPKNVFKVSIEAASSNLWNKYTDMHFGVNKHGLSGKGEDIYGYFGLTFENITEEIVMYIKTE